MIRRYILIILAVLSIWTSACAAVRPTNLRVLGLQEPIGIDQTPVFSWQIDSDAPNFVQKAYTVTVNDGFTGEQIWTSQRVESSQTLNILYEGAPLKSRHPYTWTVTVEGSDNGSAASSTSTFETAFLSPNEWTAKWIGAERNSITSRKEIVFDQPVEAQFLKIDVTRLGLQADGDWNLYYLQFAEIEIYSGTTNVARTATFSSTSTLAANANWNAQFINDGVIGSNRIGYTSNSFNSQNQHVVLTFNFGSIKTIDRVVLYPRQDVRGKGSTTSAASFPASYTVQTSTDNSTYSVQYTADNEPIPEFRKPTDSVPYYAKSFALEEGKTIVRARIYASALGVFTMMLNGTSVTENRLEPGESAYNCNITYSTYDVSALLKSGNNNLVATVAGGIFSPLDAEGRYTKPEIKNTGTPALIAELFIDYDDGTTQHIVTDGIWKTAPSPTTAVNWWGGEDYDARRQLPLDDFSTWDAAQEISPYTNLPIEKGGQNAIGKLIARQHEPVRVVETWRAKSVTRLANGHYVVDFGQNFAGNFVAILKGKAGQTLRFQTSEQLNADGSVNAQGYYGGQIVVYDTYTFANDAPTNWQPHYIYHGFRYVEVSGMTEAPQPEDFIAQRMRLNVRAKSTFITSNELVNSIHRICRNSVESQMFNVFTDCPQREKIGWLDVPNQMYNSIALNFDFQTFGYKIAQDCFDAQSYYTGAKLGKVPSTVPHFFTDWDDDPNWGGSAILVPYRTWRTYGDRSLIVKHYDGMKRLVNYYTSLTSGNIMPGSSYSALSDWGQGSSGLAKETTAEFTITCTYYYLLKVMAEVAAETGHTADVATFNNLAAKVRTAFNNRFYNKSTAVYEFGNQAEYAMPLYYGLVDEDQEERVAAKLAAKVKSDNYKVKTGECGLKPVLMMLAKYGYNDIVWEMANQTDYPSYGYFVQNGCTTTPELWNLAYSQNHCMLDHIEEWFYSQLAGIQNTGFGYDTFLIAPYVPADLTHLASTVSTVRGDITSEFTQTEKGVDYHIVIPANTTATIRLKTEEGQSVYLNGKELPAGDITVGGGTYDFTVGPASGTGVSTTSATVSTTTFYNLAGIQVNPDTISQKHGIYVVRQGNVVKKYLF